MEKKYPATVRSYATHRCFIAKGSKQIKHCSLHHFSDSSEEGYGQVTYLRTVDESNKIFCNIVMAKSRVTSLKFVSVPRLELTGTKLAEKVATHLKQWLDIKTDEEMFWTDSRVVLSYIQNTKKRFKMFLSTKSKAVLMCHSGITFRRMKNQQTIALEVWK